jgi:hypothetical protein
MGDRNCAEVRRLVIDARGIRAGLPAGALEHLDSCGDCSALLELVAHLAPGAGAPTPDYAAADLALDRARAIWTKRRRAMELALFVAGASVVSAALVTAGALGCGLPILAFQVLAFVTLPFAGFALLRKKVKGGSPWVI